MASRRKVGLIYQYNENWIGGTYYIENLIAAINSVPDKNKPSLYLFCKSKEEFEILCSRVKYDDLHYRDYKRRLNIIERIINKASRLLLKKNICLPFYNDIDIVFPAANEEKFKKNQKFLYWIPDFQEHFLPQFFSEDEITARKNYQKNIVDKKWILLSSNSVLNHFNSIYPFSKIKKFVVPFAVTHSNFNLETTDYPNLPAQYFICCNQFWKHKNHFIVLRAVKALKDRGINVSVIFTGKETDYRNPDYIKEVKKYSSDYELDDQIYFLGFIDRSLQLKLLSNSISVIQPSLFEGWSTVIEDAKSLGTNIIASHIDVHVEQLENYDNKKIFNSDDEQDLITSMLYFLEQPKGIIKNSFNYESNIVKFGNSFLNAVESIISTKNS